MMKNCHSLEKKKLLLYTLSFAALMQIEINLIRKKASKYFFYFRIKNSLYTASHSLILIKRKTSTTTTTIQRQQNRSSLSLNTRMRTFYVVVS